MRRRRRSSRCVGHNRRPTFSLREPESPGVAAGAPGEGDTVIRRSRLKRGFAHALRTRGAGGRWFADRAFSATMRELLSLAWPIATAMGGETVMGLVDTKLEGGLGPAALGGVGVAMTIAFLGYMTVFDLMRGVQVCVAHAVGEGRPYLGARYALAGVGLGLVAGAVFGLLTRDAGPLFRL